MSTEEEREFFKNNYRKFCTGASSSQNSHDSYDYDEFARFWNEKVEALEKVCNEVRVILGSIRPPSDMTFTHTHVSTSIPGAGLHERPLSQNEGAAQSLRQAA